MRTVTHVLFDFPERQTIRKANLSAQIVYNQEPETIRLLNGIASVGDALSSDRLTRALDAYRRLGDVIAEQASESYWLERSPDVPGDDKLPEAMRASTRRRTLIEARTAQLVEVREAAELVYNALQSTDPAADDEARQEVLL